MRYNFTKIQIYNTPFYSLLQSISHLVQTNIDGKEKRTVFVDKRKPRNNIPVQQKSSNASPRFRISRWFLNRIIFFVIF